MEISQITKCLILFVHLPCPFKNKHVKAKFSIPILFLFVNLGRCVLNLMLTDMTKCDRSLFKKYGKPNNNSYVLNLNLFLTFTSMVYHYYN